MPPLGGTEIPLVPLVVNTAAAEHGALRPARRGGRRSDPGARVNAAWDGWFLEQLTTGVLAPVTALGDEEDAGSGGHEVRTWLIGLAAAAEPFRWTAYEPVPEWITGMGIATTFAVT